MRPLVKKARARVYLRLKSLVKRPAMRVNGVTMRFRERVAGQADETERHYGGASRVNERTRTFELSRSSNGSRDIEKMCFSPAHTFPRRHAANLDRDRLIAAVGATGRYNLRNNFQLRFPVARERKMTPRLSRHNRTGVNALFSSPCCYLRNSFALGSSSVRSIDLHSCEATLLKCVRERRSVSKRRRFGSHVKNEFISMREGFPIGPDIGSRLNSSIADL